MSPGGRSNGNAGRNSGGTGQRGGTNQGGGTTKRPGDTTPPGDANGDCGPGSGPTFTPGQNGTLTWNTTQAIDKRPILLYVFNGHAPSGDDFDFSRKLELDFLKDKGIVAIADDFVCEKLCVKETDFLQPVVGREPVQKWLAANMSEPAQRKAKLVLLDANGALLRTFELKELAKVSPALVVKELKKAEKVNGEHLAPPPAPKKG